MNVYVLHEEYDTQAGPRANCVHSIYETEAQALEAMETLVNEYLGHLQCTKTENQEAHPDWVYVRALDGLLAGKDIMRRYARGVALFCGLSVNTDETEYSAHVYGYSVEEFPVHTTPVRGYVRTSVPL